MILLHKIDDLYLLVENMEKHKSLYQYKLNFLHSGHSHVLELLESLGIKRGEELARAVEEANSRRVKFHFFHDGKVEEKKAEEMVGGIPDVVDVMHKEFEWLSKLYWKRRDEQ
ncbi:hypothetical protein [Metallosphaera hakonensis]|uniref:Uncharacterized protein n=1 Tax=Metallosphaera hakonensis JCM 8857 = DSM 7519 TaxID=1293036 RepID=A0A2U9ISZ2_9CREN|nr:hypothetical protein [Metallosphaera hakonensis]AWR99072.1 hypothetical protein DFR87_04485 [Metallosphaera hakonensis JCM 8857 = DSM 7519]